MNTTLLNVVLISLAAANAPVNPVFKQLTEEGVKMSDGTSVKLPPPILPDGLDAAGQRAALAKVAGAGNIDELVSKSYYAPTTVKVRTVKAAEGEGPAVRAIDLWFVVHGDWNTLTSKEFLESLTAGADEGQSRVVLKSGVLTEEEIKKRHLEKVARDDYEEAFAYTTISLFERVQLSATRRTALGRDQNSILVAAKIDPRFKDDAEYPNQWRPLVRDERAEITPGPAHPFTNAGNYAKITRLVEPADAAFIEAHLVYEEPYGWFDGANLVKQKASLMVREKVRALRRKLASADQKKETPSAEQQ